jgi:hypothetical protein
MSDASTAVLAFGSAIVGAVLHGTYQHLRDWYGRPRLQIDYEGKDGANKVDVDYHSGEKHVAEVYIRARIQNLGKRPAKNCLVFLTALTEVHQSGTTPTSFYDATPVAWPGWKFSPKDIPRGIPFYVDIMKVSKHTSGWLISVEHLYASHEKLKNYSGTYRFQLTATADNAAPVTYEIDVTYNQNWNNLRAVAHIG